MKIGKLQDIQKSLNIIRSITDKEALDLKVQALELMTQALQLHITGIKNAARVSLSSNSKRKPPTKLPKPSVPKSLNTPSLSNNPNDTVGTF